MNCFSAAQIAILDFGLLQAGTTPLHTISALLEAAQHAERLGFGRYWLAEHHAPNCAWGNPISPLALLGAATKRIRIGTGGLLLNIHSPITIASDVALLTWLYPERADLGLARGRPSTNAEAFGYLPAATPPASGYRDRVHELMRWLQSPSATAAQDAVASACVPRPGEVGPECWLLGTSTASAHMAAELGVSYACSQFHSAQPDCTGLSIYRES